MSVSQHLAHLSQLSRTMVATMTTMNQRCTFLPMEISLVSIIKSSTAASPSDIKTTYGSYFKTVKDRCPNYYQGIGQEKRTGRFQVALNPDDIKSSGCTSRNAVGTLQPNKPVCVGETFRLKRSLFQGNCGTVRVPSSTETEVKIFGSLRPVQR